MSVLSVWVPHQSAPLAHVGLAWPESAAVKWPQGLPELCQRDYTSNQASNLAANPD